MLRNLFRIYFLTGVAMAHFELQNSCEISDIFLTLFWYLKMLNQSQCVNVSLCWVYLLSLKSCGSLRQRTDRWDCMERNSNPTDGTRTHKGSTFAKLCRSDCKERNSNSTDGTRTHKWLLWYIGLDHQIPLPLNKLFSFYYYSMSGSVLIGFPYEIFLPFGSVLFSVRSSSLVFGLLDCCCLPTL